MHACSTTQQSGPLLASMFDCDRCTGVCSDAADWIAGRDGRAGAKGNGATKKLQRTRSLDKPQEKKHDVEPGGVAEAKVAPPDFGRIVEESPDSREMHVKEPRREPLAENTDEVPCCCTCVGDRLDEQTILSRAFWCLYCCCGGCGCIDSQAPCRYDATCCICRQTCEMVDIESREGICGCIQSCCNFSQICQLPVPESTPRCMCCSSAWCGFTKKSDKDTSDRNSTTSDPYTAFEFHLFENYVPLYCCCTGCTCRPVLLNLFESYYKCCCVRCSTSTVLPWHGGICTCCILLANCGPFVAHGRLPCRFVDNPICGLAGWRCKAAYTSPGVVARPRQQEMR